uniref:Uncharacterized protein n=1 Tax=Oryza punctata TaxID=4537 RepID=A0A0E0KY84_ORYPU
MVAVVDDIVALRRVGVWNLRLCPWGHTWRVVVGWTVGFCLRGPMSRRRAREWRWSRPRSGESSWLLVGGGRVWTAEMNATSAVRAYRKDWEDNSTDSRSNRTKQKHWDLRFVKRCEATESNSISIPYSGQTVSDYDGGPN